MHTIIRKALTYPVLALGSTLIWGTIELLALNRFRQSHRRERCHQPDTEAGQTVNAGRCP